MSSLGWLILVVGVAYLCWSISQKETRPPSTNSPVKPTQPYSSPPEQMPPAPSQKQTMPQHVVPEPEARVLTELAPPSLTICVEDQTDDCLPVIPRGFQIFAWRVSVAGIQFRKEDALKFIRGSGRTLTFEREATNAKDPNAIKVLGLCGPIQYFLGYVPAEVAEQIVCTGLFDVARARLEHVYEGRNGYVDIIFQVIGPKSQKQDYFDFPNTRPASSAQKEFYKFFDLAIPRGLKVGQATTTIDAHKNMLRADDKVKLLEWEAWESICDEVEDVDFAYSYGIKKISRPMLREALAALKTDGMTLKDVRDDIQTLVDKILELKPAMARADA